MSRETRDIIDLLAGIEPGSSLDGIRARRLQARDNAQKSYLSLFEPADFGDVPATDRYAVAAFVAGRAGMENEFVLTFARVNPSDLEPPPPEAAEPLDSVGAAYRLTGPKEAGLKQFLGQRIQVTGAFKDPKAAEATRAPVHGRAGQLTPADTPEIVIDTFKLVSEVCSPPVKVK